MTLDQLKAILSVAEKGSFRSAADHLGKSQPALSTTIKNFEEEYGIVLFDRNNYRPTLTEAGAAFLEVARAAFEATNHASRCAFELGKREVETTLHVSINGLIPSEYVNLIARQCLQTNPPVTLILHFALPKENHRSLFDGEVYLALAPCPRNSEKIEKIFIMNVTMVGATAKALLAGKKKATKEILTKNPQILVFDKTIGTPDETIPNAVFPGGGPRIYVSDHPTKLQYIRDGIGWGRISVPELKSHPELVAIDKKIFDPIVFQMCLLRAKDHPLGPTAQAIWKTFQNLEGKPVRESSLIAKERKGEASTISG